MSELAGNITVELSQQEAEDIADGHLLTAAYTVGRQKVRRALQLAGPSYRVHEGERAFVVMYSLTGEAVATFIKEHFPDAAWMAAQTCNRLNGRPNF